MSDSAPQRKSLLARMVRVVLMVLLSLITSIMLAYSLEQWRGEHAWRGVVNAHAATNDSFEIQAVIPTPPPVADSENFWAAPLLQPAFKFHTVQSETGEYLVHVSDDTNGIARLKALQLPPRLKGMSRWTKSAMMFGGWEAIFRAAPNFRGAFDSGRKPAENVLWALKRWDKDLAELDAASRKPLAQAPLNQGGKWGQYTEGDGYIRQAGQILSLRAAARAATGDFDGAVADIEFIERLARSLDQATAVYSHLIARSVRADEFSVLKDGMTTHAWNDAQLQRYQLIFETQLARPDLTTLLKTERNYNLAVLDKLPAGLDALSKGNDRPFEDPIDELMVMATGRGWIRQNEVTTVQYYDHLLPVAKLWTSGQLTTQQLAKSLFDTRGQITGIRNPANLGNHLLIPDRPIPYSYLARYVNDCHGGAQFYLFSLSTTIAKSHIAAIACSLERYRIGHGRYPADLKALVPKYMREVPLDSCIDQPFHYRPTDDDWFVLYSVGPDGQDNHGRYRAPYNQDNYGQVLDWPWPGKGETENTFM